MAIQHEKLDYKSAQKYLPRKGALIANWGKRDFESEILDLLESGDFWQSMRRYVGPLPTDPEGMEYVRNSYTPILKLREVLRRHVRGVIGKEPQFEVVLGDDLAPKKERLKREGYRDNRNKLEVLADEADDVQGGRWDEEGEHKIIKQAVARLCATGSCFLRYDVPPGLLIEGIDRNTGDETQGIAADTWQEAYEQTYLELAPRGSAAVYLDPYTRRKTAFYSYNEPIPGNETKTRRAIQISWIDPETGMTKVRVVRSGETSKAIQPVTSASEDEGQQGDPDTWELDTGGVLLVVDAVTDALLTPDLLQLQDIICTIGTNVKINSDVAGNPQVTTIDVATPFKNEPAPTEADPKATKRVDKPIETGPRTVQQLFSFMVKDANGKPVLDGNGKPVIQQGRIDYREPVTSQPLRDDMDYFALEIYSAVNQRHVPARASANASADMLAEMRADFADSLLETKPDIERPLRSILKARLCLAAYAAGDTVALEVFKAGRVRADLKLNAGPLSVSEKAAIQARWEGGLMTKELAMILIGDADDVEAEIQKQDAEAAKPENLNRIPTPKATMKPELVKDAA